MLRRGVLARSSSVVLVTTFMVPRALFYEHEPTVTHLKIIKRYPEDTFVERIKYFTESWRTIGARWKPYVPEILSLREYPDRRSEVVRSLCV